MIYSLLLARQVNRITLWRLTYASIDQIVFKALE
jgi:hypothetical protein